jgi:hypothetical protein
MGNSVLICKALWTLLRGSFNAYVRSSLCFEGIYRALTGNTQWDDSLLSRNDQMEWFRRQYGIISDGVVTTDTMASSFMDGRPVNDSPRRRRSPWFAASYAEDDLFR